VEGAGVNVFGVITDIVIMFGSFLPSKLWWCQPTKSPGHRSRHCYGITYQTSIVRVIAFCGSTASRLLLLLYNRNLPRHLQLD